MTFRPTWYPCGGTAPHGQHQHNDGPDNYTYLCAGREEPALTAPEVKVLTETATRVGYALGRKDAGEEIATALERCEDDARRAEQKTHKEVWFHLAAGYMRSAELAREVASRPSQAASDATSGVPGHPEVSEAVRSPQEPAEPAVDLVGALRKSVEAARERRLAEREQS